jgi:Low-density lipoprotein receptor domain class A
VKRSAGSPVKRSALAILLACSLCCSLSCEEQASSEPQDGAALCAEVATFLRGCQLLSEGELSCRIYQSAPYVTCFRRCLDGASCEDVRAQTCDDVDNAFALCKDRCEYEAFGSVDCGDGRRVDLDDRCDDVRDCANGADELRCDEPAPTFDCGGGQRIDEEQRCNGFTDCSDGRDEAGCPVRAMTLCPGGF